MDNLALREESAQGQNCTSCEGKNAATSYCFGCYDFYCGDCLRVHNRISALRGHRNVVIEKLQAQDVKELIHRPAMCAENFHKKSSVEYGKAIIQRNIAPEKSPAKQAVIRRCKDLLNADKQEIKKFPYVDYMTNEENVRYSVLGQMAAQGNGFPLTCCPLRVQVTPHQCQTVFTFGSQGNGKGQFNGPESIAVSEKTGNIAVADFNNKRIQIFSSEGKLITEFDQQGPGAKRLGEPWSVAFSRSGDVTVSHRTAEQPDKIAVFAESGQFMKHITNKHLRNPWKVSVGQDGYLIVLGWRDHTIKVLSTDGTELLRSFSAPDCRWFPESAVCYQETFFVSYFWADCVKVFNKEGVFLYNIGSEGSGDGQFNGPVGLAVDTFGRLIVCDSKNNRLQVFTLDGKFVTKIEPQRTGRWWPWSVAVSNDGRMFVTDVKKHCIHVFH